VAGSRTAFPIHPRLPASSCPVEAVFAQQQPKSLSVYWKSLFSPPHRFPAYEVNHSYTRNSNSRAGCDELQLRNRLKVLIGRTLMTCPLGFLCSISHTESPLLLFACAGSLGILFRLSALVFLPRMVSRDVRICVIPGVYAGV
jgi:hypothetical protein